MFFPEGQIRVQLYGRPADMRKSFDGLSVLVRQELRCDPLSGQLFVFVGDSGPREATIPEHVKPGFRSM